MTSSYTDPNPTVDQQYSTAFYETDVDPYYHTYEDDAKWSLFGKEDKSLSIIVGIIPIILAVIIVAIIIAIIVELKTVNNAVSLSGRAWGWYDSFMSKINEVDTDSLLHRMFPNGVTDVLLSIEDAYKKYRNGKSIKKTSKKNKLR